MSEIIKIQFICEVCTTRLIVECDESVWTFKHQCEECQIERTFLRDVVIADPSPHQPSPPDLIYLFRAGNLYKIGISNNPERRLQDFSTSPVPVEFVWASQVEDAKDIEKQLHKTFRQKCIRGEWFELSEADVDYVKGLGSNE